MDRVRGLLLELLRLPNIKGDFRPGQLVITLGADDVPLADVSAQIERDLERFIINEGTHVSWKYLLHQLILRQVAKILNNPLKRQQKPARGANRQRQLVRAIGTLRKQPWWSI